jgi:hypothetical protein
MPLEHLIGKTTVNTEHIEGKWGEFRWGVGPWGKAYLLIDYGADADERFQTAEQLLDEAVTFWRGFFDDHAPKPPRH